MAVEYRRHPQHPLELRVMREWVKDAESILEIGSRYGDNLIFLAVSMKGNRLVSLDWPGVEYGVDGIGDHIRIELKSNCKKLRDAGFDVDLFIGDSHDPQMAAQIAKKGPFDVVFIDGDHSYEGVKMDWEMYGHLGKMVMFHDVKPGNGHGVAEFWGELSSKMDSEEFIAHNSKMGIGRVWNTA